MTRSIRLTDGETVEERARRLASLVVDGWMASMPTQTAGMDRRELERWFLTGYLAAAQDWCGEAGDV